MLKFAVSILAVAGFGILQVEDIYIFGVKPNLILPVVLLAGLVNRSWLQRAVLALAALITVQFYPGVELGGILFLTAIAAGFLILNSFPTKTIMNFLTAVAAGTLIINLHNFILKIFIIESAYNLIFAGIIYLIVDKYYGLEEPKI